MGHIVDNPFSVFSYLEGRVSDLFIGIIYLSSLLLQLHFFRKSLVLEKREILSFILLSLLLFLYVPFFLEIRDVVFLLPFLVIGRGLVSSLSREENSPFKMANIGIIAAVLLLVWPPIILIFPLFLYSVYTFTSFSFRKLFAILLAFSFTLFTALSLLFFLDLLLPFVEKIKEIYSFHFFWQDLKLFKSINFIIPLFYFLFLILGIILYPIRNLSQKVHIIKIFELLEREVLFFLPVLLAINYFSSFAFLTIFSSSLLLSKGIRSKKVFRTILLLLFLGILLLYIYHCFPSILVFFNF